jgi:RNA 2',3'-cyclic 3'-phosphodiesterase
MRLKGGIGWRAGVVRTMEATLLRAGPRRSVPAVAKERLKSPRVRLFVALDLPDDIRGEIEAWQARECADEALRPVAEEALHVTLCFLGYHPQKTIDDIAALVTGVAPRPVPMRLEGEPVPIKGRRPGLFALDAPSEAAERLQAELEANLAGAGFYKPEKRPFWSHVTVARVRSERLKGSTGRRRRGRPRIVERSPGPLPEALERPFDAVRVALYRSNLRPQGAVYERLAALELPPASGGTKE